MKRNSENAVQHERLNFDLHYTEVWNKTACCLMEIAFKHTINMKYFVMPRSTARSD